MLYLINIEDPATPAFIDACKQYVVTSKNLSAENKGTEIVPILCKDIKKTNLKLEHNNIWDASYTFVIKKMNIDVIYFRYNSIIYRAFCPAKMEGIAMCTHIANKESYLPITKERIWGNKDFFTAYGTSNACSSTLELDNTLHCSAYSVRTSLTLNKLKHLH